MVGSDFSPFDSSDLGIFIRRSVVLENYSE